MITCSHGGHRALFCGTVCLLPYFIPGQLASAIVVTGGPWQTIRPMNAKKRQSVGRLAKPGPTVLHTRQDSGVAGLGQELLRVFNSVGNACGSHQLLNICAISMGANGAEGQRVRIRNGDADVVMAGYSLRWHRRNGDIYAETPVMPDQCGG